MLRVAETLFALESAELGIGTKIAAGSKKPSRQDPGTRSRSLSMAI
jgi:hypothetical protein